MKKQLFKRLPAFIALIILTITVLLFNAGCSKDTKSLDFGKKPTGGSTIVYTDLKPDSVILKTNPASFNLDLDNDGINDFVFNRYDNRNQCSFPDGTGVVPYTYLSVYGGSIMTPAIIPNAFNLVSALDSSTAIAPVSLWATTSLVLLYGASTSGYIRCMKASGYWLNVSDKYLGLKFIKGNNTYYGWARLSCSYSATPAPYRHLIIGQLILKDYAYNSVSNKPILAGQTK